MPLLENRNALVMGIVNRWSLAHAIAAALAREGARLHLTYQGERQRETVEQIAAAFPQARAWACDVSNDEQIASLFARLQSEKVELDCLAHSIAFAQREDLDRAFELTSREGFRIALDVSAYSFVAVARAAAALMPRGGSMLTLTYLGAQRVIRNYNVMGVAKAALEASVRYLAADLGPRGIRVNALSAGPVKTASARGIRDFSSILDQVAQRAPLRRNTDPGEVGDAAVFLASDLSRGITGEVLYVDSGFHILGI